MKRNTFFRFASPSIIIMMLLMVIPLIMAIWLGTNYVTYNNIASPQFVGLRNFIEVLEDPVFWRSFRFTGLYMIVVVPMQIIVGFTVAILLDQVSKFSRGIYLSIFLLPFIIVPIVGTLMFKQLFEPSGLLRWAYQTIFDTKFLYTEITVKALILFHGVWLATPFALVTYFAGIQTLPIEQIEAASIDGASGWQKIRYIVIPHVRSLTIFILLISLMDAYRIFDSIFVLTRMNPIYKADTLMTYTFKTAMTVQRLGKADAMAVLTVVGVMIILIPNLIQTYKEQMRER
ncbi:MAG: sugar ABC transporter permease [Anaerolineae bacterium]|jgi:ABC-type sugar transport system permease subunit|nr:sugar ABC transporter permease [Anaerolineae bacterium]MBT7190261.1 sugar ABC transporter permease [Anaerolineae bacterium]MBT7991320.1 sugar ABC transporter permease [Anaerolineae bacterium]